jgi:hypothetical protein
MKKFKISYTEGDVTEDEDIPYPAKSILKFEYDFHDSCTWDVILYQFCKVLEATGYVGVTNKIKLDDPYGMMKANGLFASAENEDYPWEDEEDEEEDEQEELKFGDMKKEVA